MKTTSKKPGHSTPDSSQHREPRSGFRVAVISPTASSDAAISVGTVPECLDVAGLPTIIPLGPNRHLVLVPEDLPGSLQGLLCVGWAREYLVYPCERAPQEIYALVRDALSHGNFWVIK